MACRLIIWSVMPFGSMRCSRARYITRRAISASRMARRACGLTCVVSTAVACISAAMPNSTALMPQVSASVSSVTLPTPSMMGASGKRWRSRS
ncbi:hypothetical protein D3C72_2107970 [compost metagenome]